MSFVKFRLILVKFVDICFVLELEKEISKELLFGAELIDKKTETEKIDDETVKVTVIMNFIEEIGTEKRIDEVTQVEPKTDRITTGD